MNIRCVICAKADPREGATICPRCLGRIDDDLSRIAELTREAAKWSVHPASKGEGGRSVPGSRPPLNVDVVSASDERDTLMWLESWERMTREHFGMAPYRAVWPLRNAESARLGVPVAQVFIKGATAFLRAQLLRMTKDADYPIEELSGEARKRVGVLYSLVPDKRCKAHAGWDHPPLCRSCDVANGHAGIAVDCPADHPDADGRRCGYELRVDIKRPADDVYCARCGTAWAVSRLVLVALSDPEITVWAYPADIATFGVKASTLRQWHSRGHIRKNGNRYDVGAAWRRRMDA